MKNVVGPRTERPVASQKLGLPAVTGPTPVLYHANLLDPTTYFSVQQFAMRDRDVLYIANARANKLQKIMGIVSGVFTPLSVGKQVKRMATGFYGRISAYQAGLAGDADLIEALKHNLFGTVAEPDPTALDWFAGYLRREAAFLARVPAESITGGRVVFSPFSDEEAV